MKLSDFKLLPKGKTGILGNQALLSFGSYTLSVIDDGYGKDQGLYEIGVFKNGDLIELPGITNEGDQVRGYLTQSDVDAVIMKMHAITGVEPTQV